MLTLLNLLVLAAEVASDARGLFRYCYEEIYATKPLRHLLLNVAFALNALFCGSLECKFSELFSNITLKKAALVLSFS